jgi:hypothetical protein
MIRPEFLGARTAKAVEFRIAPVVRVISATKDFATADAVELFAHLSSTTAVVAANLTLLFTPDDRGYSKFNRSAIRFWLFKNSG